MLRRFTHLAILFSSLTGFIFAVRSHEFRSNVHQSQWEITAPPEPIGSVQVPPGSPFKIALFSDLHFGENSWTAWGPQQDMKSVGVMSTVLDQEHPDFVIYLGDVITANNIPTKNASLYWEQAISPTRARRIQWASVFGNHDDMPFEWPLEWFSTSGVPPIQCPQNISYPGGYKDCSFGGTTRLELMKYEVDHNTLSHSKCGPRVLWPSVSNYVLKISLTSDPDTAVAYMYFLDSGGGSYPEVISNAQVEWFSHTVQELNPDARVPELMFWHIPSQDYHRAAADHSQRKTCVGSMFAERVAAQEAEMGIMELLGRRRSSVKAVFVGHNHGLDWCCPYNKLWLCYARHTGYGGYGSWARGARILEITQHPFALKSWIRMENGTVHSEVILSSS